MGKASRDKGKRGEREVAERFREAGFDAKRSVGQSRCGSDAPDVVVDGLPWLWVEVKRGKKTNIRAALAQARFQCAADQVPISITRDDGEREAVVSMDWPLFAKVLKKAYPEALVQTDLPGVEHE